MVRRAGIISTDELLARIENNINTIENDPGRKFQSLSQSSYNTWSEGPFGRSEGVEDKSISYYDKGPIMGLILDLTIRNATQNKKSLDDVMRFLYSHYYKNLNRGFTDAELQYACEIIAGKSLSAEFEYVYTTKEIDYSKYLSYAGLKITEMIDRKTSKRRFIITRQDSVNSLHQTVFQAWSEKDGSSIPNAYSNLE
ncbi:MAG TPA: hypothetical protein PLN06_06350 [Bacteroidales bacterium]|nr:hypothetical protein [Bacteroidales bacterium]HQG36953.1 hypothetical protein [Bacteroidales bacterium]HQG52034.1 hypothetical protein [Bacteroidales bacterium]HQJ21211.1 hypothetical protein [Bacteroidales bacterium]HRC89554.1 hypothetical protein [Bacteroidales bacterium]